MQHRQVPLNVKIRKICEIHPKCWNFSKSANFNIFSVFQKRTQKSMFFIFSPEKMAQFFFLDSELEAKSWDKVTKSEKSESVKIFKLIVFINTFRVQIWSLERYLTENGIKENFPLIFFLHEKKKCCSEFDVESIFHVRIEFLIFSCFWFEPNSIRVP